MKKKIFYFFILLTFLSFFIFRYSEYYKNYNNYDEKIAEVQKVIYSFFYYTGNEELIDDNQIRRLNLCSPELENLKVLNNGYKIIYSQNKYILYSFGRDKKDNKLKNIPFNFIDSLNNYSFNKPNFIQYLFNFNEYDIVLFTYKKTENSFLYESSHFREKTLFLDKNCEEIDKIPERNINNIIKKIESTYLDRPRNTITYEEVGQDKKYTQLFFKIENEKVICLNYNRVSEKRRGRLESALKESFFKLNDMKKINYAFFSIIIKQGIGKSDIAPR
jgi:hypothetical protein